MSPPGSDRLKTHWRSGVCTEIACQHHGLLGKSSRYKLCREKTAQGVRPGLQVVKPGRQGKDFL